jgi:hypothetical protein
MKCAVVHPQTNKVVNVIVADPQKDSLPGLILIAVDDDQMIDSQWQWSAKRGFEPNQERKAELQMEAEFTAMEAAAEAAEM